uniref:Uncharacterized protein n=1 Tax=Physcomitrium patens TaxID=3218 RepID=A0A2K1IZ32_PHYPA|nr:hypothetical protein PHYPA_024350 [Physcomitrium patens]
MRLHGHVMECKKLRRRCRWMHAPLDRRSGSHFGIVEMKRGRCDQRWMPALHGESPRRVQASRGCRWACVKVAVLIPKP